MEWHFTVKRRQFVYMQQTQKKGQLFLNLSAFFLSESFKEEPKYVKKLIGLCISPDAFQIGFLRMDDAQSRRCFPCETTK